MQIGGRSKALVLGGNVAVMTPNFFFLKEVMTPNGNRDKEEQMDSDPPKVRQIKKTQ